MFYNNVRLLLMFIPLVIKGLFLGKIGENICMLIIKVPERFKVQNIILKFRSIVDV